MGDAGGGFGCAGNSLVAGVEESRSLVINGQAGQAPVVRMQGKSYVELEALARLTRLAEF